jgi:hypothetical protein
MTYIGKIDLIENAYKKMLLGEQISFEENSLLLATAICLLDEYDADQTKKLFFEISYEIIARYSVSTSDYRPLYDFSVNYGFFPIVDYILEHDEDFLQSVADVINKVNIDKYRSIHSRKGYDFYHICLLKKIGRQVSCQKSYHRFSIINILPIYSLQR